VEIAERFKLPEGVEQWQEKGWKLIEKTPDAVAFSIFMLELEPFDYQIDFLLDNSKRQIFVAGRQVGKTTMTAIKALFFALKNKGVLVLTLAPTFRQASILFDRIREMILRNPLLMALVERMTQTMVFFKNGSRIFCLPSGHTGETVRGYPADMVIIDEAAYVPDEVFVAIEPSLTTTHGWLLFLGTPAGKIGRFWEAWNSEHFSKHHAKTEDNPLASKDFIEERRKSLTEVQFAQEFLGEFAEEVDVFFPYRLVKPLMVLEPKEEVEEGWDYCLGVDVARYGTDETAYVIVRTQDYENWQMVNYITTKKKPLTDVMGRIKDLHKKWNFRSIVIDETGGLGAGVVDKLKEDGLPIEGFTFSPSDREKMYNNLKWLLEDKKVLLLNDIKLLNQFQSLRYEYTSAGRLKIIKDERGHEDIVDALGIAVYRKVEKWTVLEDKEGVVL